MNTYAPKKTRDDHPAKGGKTAKVAKADAELAEALRPGQSVELLKELHILTREGRLNQDSRRKLKQVYHLFQFIEQLLRELPEGGANATLADHGAGKSYLGFIVYDLFFRAGQGGQVYGIETRAELVKKSRELAQRLGFDRMSFLNLTVAESASASELPSQIDVVTALHACDTATDDAIAFGLAKKARCMVLVPCCQAEVAACPRPRRWRSRARRWPSSGAIRCTRARSAASSPTCCAACTSRPTATASP
jgi:Methyltransferase domain